MATVEGTALVLSTTHRSANPDAKPKGKAQKFKDIEDHSGTLAVLEDVFASNDYRTDEECIKEDRPSKRRRVEPTGTVALARQQQDSTKSIVLARVSLLLSPSDPRTSTSGTSITGALNALPESNETSSPPINVVLKSFTQDVYDGTKFEIRIETLDAKTSISVSAQSDASLLQSLSPHLHNAAALATTVVGRKSQSLHRASFARCRLHPPASTTPVTSEYTLEVEIRWTLGISVVEHPAVKLADMKHDLKLLSRYLGGDTSKTDSSWALSDFYESVHVPPVDCEIPLPIQRPLPDTTLYPFQQRAVSWLLKREGCQYSSQGLQVPCSVSSQAASFRQTQDAAGKACHISQLRGIVVSDLSEATDHALQSLRGGLLAEEMGLGKTVELIALILLHKRQMSTSETITDIYTGTQLKTSAATLIITPPSILEQWASELQTHAPELKVFTYKGLPPASAPKREHSAATVENLFRYDVVLTTYPVLSREIHHAKPPPDRSSRYERQHERRRCPLVEISWWRVCLDEAQMVESGVSQAATVARLIPRCNAWAVTGTPLRKDIQDLRGLLIFLRCDALANKALWDRLDKTSFRAIFSQIALRHTKDTIRDELRLPPQKRIVITLPFTAIEEQHYTEMMRQMCDACWLTPEGHPTRDGYDADHPDVVERMREWLLRLRQTCLHANVGRKNRRALGTRNGALRTIQEVLEVMIEQNDTKWKSEAREMIVNQIKRGHIKAYAGNVVDRAQSALPYYEDALKDAQEYVAMCRQELQAERKRLKKPAEETTEENLLSASEEEKQDEVGRIAVMLKSLRSFLEVEHACYFFIATTYHQIKSNETFTQVDSEEFHRLDKLEAEWYEKAKVVRRELLRISKKRAEEQMAKISSKIQLTTLKRIKDLPDAGGIESRKILETMDNISDFLNAQAEQLEKWRAKNVEILLMRLIDDEDDQETTGEEYDDSLKAQDELYVYTLAQKALIADRNTAVHGLSDGLIEYDMKFAETQARRTEDDDRGRGHAPELMIEVVDKRRKLQALLHGESLKGVVSQIRSMATGLQWKADGGDTRAAAEIEVVQKYLAQIQAIMADQARTVTDLEREQEVFRDTMNQRLEYYRQFQHISDTVAKWKDDLDETFDEREFTKYSTQREDNKKAVAGFKNKCTYLIHLRAENQKDDTADCIICQCPIEIGVLTTCGHKYCKDCINQWWHQHRTCPLCKQKLKSSDFKDISFKPNEIKAQEEVHESPSPTQSSTPTSSAIYSGISDATMDEIKMIDLNGSYGSKVDMIARHLIWIRKNDPGAKSVIFSQFGDFLEVLRSALTTWKIGVSAFQDSNKQGIQKFKSDPAIECFLLDAKSDSSGLNLVNATYVFLCEPLINPAIELQAIARVHRIGQQRTTTVFMYLVSDTVEESIYDISVARRLEHIGKGKAAESRSGTATPVLQEKTLDAANSAELQAVPLKQLLRKKGDGEIVQTDDLWKCLFAKPRKPSKPVLEMVVGRHLRASAAEDRIAGATA